MRVHVAAVVLAIAFASWSPPSYAYNMASGITYTIGDETLAGYSRTWKDPTDLDYYECISWTWDDYGGQQCVGIMMQINYVYVAGTLTSPSGSTEGGYTTAYYDAQSTFSKSLPAIPPGIWTVDGDHKVFSDIYYQYCYYNFCSYPAYAGTYWFDIGTTHEQAMVCASSQSVIDSAVIGVLVGYWPSSEPWERGVMARCGGNDVILFGYYNDSFGYAYGSPYTNDPCKSTIGPVAVDRAAGAHSHPYFQNAAQFHAGLGCFGDQNPISQQDLQQLNATNESLSAGDRVAIAASGERPLYLKTPTGTRVKRLDTSSGSEVTVYP